MVPMAENKTLEVESVQFRVVKRKGLFVSLFVAGMEVAPVFVPFGEARVVLVKMLALAEEYDQDLRESRRAGGRF